MCVCVCVPPPPRFCQQVSPGFQTTFLQENVLTINNQQIAHPNFFGGFNCQILKTWVSSYFVSFHTSSNRAHPGCHFRRRDAERQEPVLRLQQLPSHPTDSGPFYRRMQFARRQELVAARRNNPSRRRTRAFRIRPRAFPGDPTAFPTRNMISLCVCTTSTSLSATPRST